MVLAFMYPTTIAGSVLAMLIPTIFSTTIEPSQAFTHPLAYQYFLYHAMLLILGIYIYRCDEIRIRPRHCLTTMGILSMMAFLSLYVNSIFAAPTYRNGELVSLDFVPNMFFTYEPPIDAIVLTTITDWYLYLAALVLIACVLILAFYIPIFRRENNREK